MAKKEIKPKVEKKKIELPKKEKHNYFPKFLILFSLVVIALALNSFFNWFSLPSYVSPIVLLIAGVWMLFMGLGRGMYNQRHEKLKKFI